MAVNSYACELDSLVIYKFDALLNGLQAKPNLSTAMDLAAQVHEIAIYQSVFSPVIKVEFALIDSIGLFVNFPLSGEEVVVFKYKNIADGKSNTLYLVIDAIKDINIGDDARQVGFMMNCVSIEAWANARQGVMQAYEGGIPDSAKKLLEEHLNEPIKKFFPSYPTRNVIVENNDSQTQTVVIPNMNPFVAMNMLADLAVAESKEVATYLFFQTLTEFKFVTMQGLFNGPASRRKARAKGYKYMANEIDIKDALQQNEGRVISNMVVNKRHATFQKMSTGYFQNKLFEINIAQKAFWSQERRLDETTKMNANYLNSDAYIQMARVEGGDDEANRVKFVVTTQREHDDNMPLSRFRERWGYDQIAHTAMGQIDLTVVIPGTNEFQAGDLFYVEIPEMHGFNELKEDEFISGMFFITEVKHMLSIGGYHTTVLRINKDSYNRPIDRASQYV